MGDKTFLTIPLEQLEMDIILEGNLEILCGLIETGLEKCAFKKIQMMLFFFFLKIYPDVLLKINLSKKICTEALLISNVQKLKKKLMKKENDILQGPVVQSVFSLTSSLRVISLIVLVDSIYNILTFFAEKMWVAFALQKLLTFFQQKISTYLRITRCKF